MNAILSCLLLNMTVKNEVLYCFSKFALSSDREIKPKQVASRKIRGVMLKIMCNMCATFSTLIQKEAEDAETRK